MRTINLILAAILLLSSGPFGVPLHPSAMIAVSGTVTGPGGPVAGAWIGINAHPAWKETTTDATGHYQVAIQNGGRLGIQVRPPSATGLAQDNFYTENVTGDVQRDFTLVPGYLLSLRPTGIGGATIWQDIGFEIRPFRQLIDQSHWFNLYWDEPAQSFQAVLPPDVYQVTAHPPAGYFETSIAYDLRTSAQVAILPINTAYIHPIPYDPPQAAKITVGPPDGLGEASVTGAPGAALPLAHVLLVNLNSAHQAHAISAADGSFTARIYAPPGSALMVKHGPESERWNDLEVGMSEGVNPYPGTILYVPHSPAGQPLSQAFAAAGAVQFWIDDPNTTLNYVGAAWGLQGSLGRVSVDGAWTRLLDGKYNGSAVPGLYLGGLNWTHPAPGDMDSDGDLDLLVGERSGRLVLYRNAGGPAAPDWIFEAPNYAGVDTGEWAYPALADVTADGAPDLFVGSGNGAVQVYYNDGTPAAPAWPASPDQSLSAGQNNAAPALDDLDGDGDLDLVSGHAGGTLVYFKNTGTPTTPVWSLNSTSYGGIRESAGSLQPAFLDLDGDSDRDLLAGLCGQMVWYRRGGSAAAPAWTRVAADPLGYGGGSCGSSPGVGDWDGDGDRDVITGEHWGVLRFFRNGGPPAWSEPVFSFPFDLQGESAPALADWDNDGDPDLLIGQAHGQVYQYTNTGSAASPSWRPDGVLLSLPWTNHPHAFPALADVDGDGDEDLFLGEGGYQGAGAGGNIHYYRNDGTPAAPSWALVTDSFLGLDVGGWSTPAFVDINADGDLDLFVGDEAGSLTYVQNTGSATAPAWAAPVQPYAGLHLGSFSAPAFLDIDADGDLDLVSGQENGSLAYVRNAGNRFNPQWELVSTVYPGIDVGGRSIPAVSDLSGDGKPDLLLGDIDGGVNLYRYDGPGSPPPPGDTYTQGDLFEVKSTLRIYGQGITPGTDLGAIAVIGRISLLLQHNAQGQPVTPENYFMSSLLTPTGFPIQGATRPMIPLGASASVGNLHFIAEHAVEGDFTIAGQVPAGLPAGIYRPLISFAFTGVPTSTTWLAANVTYHTFFPNEAALPPIVIGQAAGQSGRASGLAAPRLVWRLLMDDFVQGTRGAGAREDQGVFELASQIVSQGAPLTIPPLDERTGQPIVYRLEPFLPMVSYTDRRMPTPPLIPFDLPGGQLHVTVQRPDGSLQDLGSEAFAQSFNRTKTTRYGQDLNNGTVQLEDVYSLKAASNRFRVTFDQLGHYTITMTGTLTDVWGNAYTGGGTYDVWVAYPLDIDPGLLPGTPLAAGDALSPALQLYPGVPADITLTVTHYPNSDPAQKITRTIAGKADRNGYFSSDAAPVELAQPGEYRVDLTASYTDSSGKLYMGAMTWGGVVMTPPGQADLVAHGRRGLDSLSSIPNHWFVSSRDLTIPSGAISHSLNPYYNGDILWSRMSDQPFGGDSLILGGSVQDQIGLIKAAIQARANRMHPSMTLPGNASERFSREEIPLFISTHSGQPPAIVPADIDQLAYSYRSSQRPGVRVREVVAEDGQSGGYWRLDTLYDDQLGVGVAGDLPNDFKFQYVGAVYRDLDSGHNEYLGQGSGWVFIPEDDPLGSRVMPPFAGPGNGGWTAEGGPMMKLKGMDIHIFIYPTGVQPGAVLEVGDRFHFSGHLMPTLDSQVTWTATAPSGVQHSGGGQANSIGYFYDPADDFTVNEPGLWAVDVHVWHAGQCSGGTTVSPYPSGDVLGSENGRYWFYVIPAGAQPLAISTPSPGFLTLTDPLLPIVIRGAIPAGLSAASVEYTLRMPGFILDHGQAAVSGGQFEVMFDPLELQNEFPNLDLNGRDAWQSGLSDTFWIGLLLRGQSGGETVYRATAITLQGEQVFVDSAAAGRRLFLPLINRR